MSRRPSTLVLAALAAWWLPALPAVGGGPPPLRFRTLSLELPADVLHLRWADRDGDGALDLFALGPRRVVCYGYDPERGFPSERSESIALPEDPALVDLGALPEGDSAESAGVAPGPGGARVVLLSRRGVLVESRDGEDPDATPAFRRVLRVRGIPEPLLHLPVTALGDFDGDGVEDLLVPLSDGYELFRASGDGFERALSLRTETRIELDAGGPDLLRPLKTGITIPRLTFEDFNGDGRVDIAAESDEKTHFFLRTASGFPREPDFILDVSRWEAEGGQEPRRFEARLRVDQQDIDGDGRRDFLVTSGERIRVFFGGPHGVHFGHPDVLLKVSDDLLGVLGLDVDGDRRVDLVAIKFRMPSISRLIAALFVAMDFDLELLGYRNVGSRRFARRPTHRNRLTFSLPPILDLLESVDSLSDEFLEATAESARLAFGDVDGDGLSDAVHLEEAGGEHRLRVFLAPSRDDVLSEELALGPVLFNEDKQRWSFEEAVEFVANAAYATRVAALARREAAVALAVEEPYRLGELELDVRDLNADGRGDIVLRLDRRRLRVLVQETD